MKDEALNVTLSNGIKVIITPAITPGKISNAFKKFISRYWNDEIRRKIIVEKFSCEGVEVIEKKNNRKMEIV